MSEFHIICESKSEFIELQRYLIDVKGYIWRDGSTSWLPSVYRSGNIKYNYNSPAMVFNSGNKKLMCQSGIKEYSEGISYKDYIAKEKIFNMEKYINDLFNDIE